MKLTPHFNAEEFDCKNGEPTPQEFAGNFPILAEALERIRAACGHRPIIIHSGYRTPDYNRAVWGQDNSLHLQGKAVDFHVINVSPMAVKRAIEKLIKEGSIPQGGIGVAKHFVHYDIRGERARWWY